MKNILSQIAAAIYRLRVHAYPHNLTLSRMVLIWNHNVVPATAGMFRYRPDVWVARGIYQFFRRLDSRHQYRGETAPYCGHAYSGVSGRFVREHWDEIGGSGSLKFRVLGMRIVNEDGDIRFAI